VSKLESERVKAFGVRSWMRPHFPILSARNNRHWKLLAQFSLSRERDVANIIAK